MTNPTCRYCRHEMREGETLSLDQRRSWTWRLGSRVWAMFNSLGGLQRCWKCPQCGYSKTKETT